MDRGIKRKSLVALSEILCFFVGISFAYGHAPRISTHTTRYIQIFVKREGVEIFYTAVVGRYPAFEVLKRADRDGDGLISRGEERKLLWDWTARLRESINFRFNGNKKSFTAVKGGIRLLSNRVDLENGLTLDWLFRFFPSKSVEEGVYTVSFWDRSSFFPRLGETEIDILTGNGVKLISSQLWNRTGELEKKFLFRGPERVFEAKREIIISFFVSGASGIEGASTRPQSLGFFRREEGGKAEAVRSFTGVVFLVFLAALFFSTIYFLFKRGK